MIRRLSKLERSIWVSRFLLGTHAIAFGGMATLRLADQATQNWVVPGCLSAVVLIALLASFHRPFFGLLTGHLVLALAAFWIAFGAPSLEGANILFLALIAGSLYFITNGVFASVAIAQELGE